MECPNHGGAFDCTPFCELCHGEQEINTTRKGNMEEMKPTVDARFDDYELRVWQNPDGYFVFVGDYKSDYEFHAFETWLEVLNLLNSIEDLIIQR